MTIFNSSELKTDIVKSILTHNLGKTKNKIYARTCKVKQVDKQNAIDLLNCNHLQGFSESDYYYGLFYDNILVSIMLFSLLKDLYHNNFTIDRFCSQIYTNVIGAASKLLKCFIKEHKPLRIFACVDRRWSDGGIYKNLGFSVVKYNKPKFYYFTNNKRFDETQSSLITNFKKKIYDCGSILFALNINNQK